MKKLKLEIDALRVDSFDTRPHPARGEGTVRGLESYPIACFPPSDSQDPFVNTCGWATCAGITCWESCNGTCNCGTVGCQPQESAGYTYCFKDASCLNQCFPTGLGC